MNPDARPGRIGAIDTLRGIVMALMLVDHVREFFLPQRHRCGSDAAVAHLCTPVLVFLTGFDAWLHGQHDRTDLFKRGLLPITLAALFRFPRQALLAMGLVIGHTLQGRSAHPAP